eukprot:6553429-Prymnesium_polylepis.1
MILPRAGVLVAALGLPSPQSTQLQLRERLTPGREEMAACEKAGDQPIDQPWALPLCVFTSGKALKAGSALQAEAVMNTTLPTLGADA